MTCNFYANTTSNPYPDFRNGEIMNELEQTMLDLLEMILGEKHYRYCPQIPLKVICSRPDALNWLPEDIWKFWANSVVDIAILEKGFQTSRKAKLVVECQSHWHDCPEAQERDAKKARLLATVGIPLVYVRRVETDRRYYRFYTPDGNAEIFYNIITQEGRSQLEAFLQQQLS